MLPANSGILRRDRAGGGKLRRSAGITRPEHRQIELRSEHDALRAQYEVMSDAELLAIVSIE